MITNCSPDAKRFSVLKECTETYGMSGENPEWPWNVLSLKTEIYSCGAIRRAESETAPPLIRQHEPEEFALCQRLADEAAAVMKDCEVGLGSEATTYFSPFFVEAAVDEPPVRELNAETIRTAFGGTIYPAAEITVEPLNEQSEWWQEVAEDVSEDADEEEREWREGMVRSWRSLMQWFGEQADLSRPSFVAIGDSPLDDTNGASVFPRLAVALTKAGSLVGIGGYVVHT